MKNTLQTTCRLTLAAALAVSLAACGGGGGGGASAGGPSSNGGGSGGATNPPPTPTPVQYALGGTVSGLGAGATVTLHNGNDSVAVGANGSFNFPAKLDNGASYKVTAELPNYSCAVVNGQGTVSGADVTGVAVTCAPIVLAGVASPVPGVVALTVDSAGNTYVLDVVEHDVKKITPSGDISIFAGSSGSVGKRDGNGAAASFHFASWSRVKLDTAGNLVITDTCNGAIRRITPAGDVSTLAGGLGGVCDNVAPAVEPGMVDGTGSNAQFEAAAAIASDGAGGVLVSELMRRGTVRKVSASGVVTTKIWTSAAGMPSLDIIRDMTLDANGVLWLADSSNRIWKIVNDSPVFVAGAATRANGVAAIDGPGDVAQFAGINAIAFGTDGNLYVAEHSYIRKVTPAGVVSTVAGGLSQDNVDGTGGDARFGEPAAISVAADGSLLVADRASRTVRRVTPAGVVTTLAATPFVRGYVDGTGGQARLGIIGQLGADANGDVYVADALNNVVRKISSSGVVSLFAGTRGTAGNADGALSSATFAMPLSVAAGPNGVLYVAQNFGLRRIQNGVVSTLSTTVHAQQMAVDADGSVALSAADGVYRYTAAGAATKLVDATMVATLLNKSASAIRFVPEALAFDAAGNLYISDVGTVAVYKLSKSGALTLFAGTPLVEEGNIDGAPGTATLGYYAVDYMAADAQGNLYLSGQGKLRKISPAGVVSTPAMGWGDAVVGSIAYSNGRLFGATNYAVKQTLLP